MENNFSVKALSYGVFFNATCNAIFKNNKCIASFNAAFRSIANRRNSLSKERREPGYEVVQKVKVGSTFPASCNAIFNYKLQTIRMTHGAI